MSTRWYPIYQKGNPQLRVFLPNFWLKLVKPTTHKLPSNMVQFIVSTEMTTLDVKNYLEKIYKVPVVKVRTTIIQGETRRERLKGYVIKDDDYKVAYVTMPKDHHFEFPDLFPKDEEKEEADRKQIEETKKGFQQFLDKNKGRPGLPGWYSI